MTENHSVVGSIPTGGTTCGVSSFGRARPCQGRGGGFEPRNPLHILKEEMQISSFLIGSIAQLGEHLPYKQRVIGSSPIVSTSAKALKAVCLQTSPFGRKSKFGPVVQLVRTLACHARGQGFESPSGRHFADLAHLVERDPAKVEVAGSSPVIRSNMVT